MIVPLIVGVIKKTLYNIFFITICKHGYRRKINLLSKKSKERIKAYAYNYYHSNKDKIKQKCDNLSQEKDIIRIYQKEWKN